MPQMPTLSVTFEQQLLISELIIFQPFSRGQRSQEGRSQEGVSPWPPHNNTGVHPLLATHASPLTAYVRFLREAVLLGGLLIFLYRP